MSKVVNFVMSPIGAILGKKVGKLVTAAALVVAGVMTGNPALIMAGISYGAAALKKVPKNKATEDRLNASLEAQAPRKLIFGHTALATDVRYQGYTDDQTYVHWIVGVACHDVQSIDELWLDTKLGWTSAGGAQGEFADYLTVTPVTSGTSLGGAAIDPTWTGSASLTGCAYLHVRFKLTGNSKKAESPFSQTIPTRITIRGKGAKLPDIRETGISATDQATWAWVDDDSGRNPALQLLFYLLGWKINGETSVGCGMPASRINLASFITAANGCDEPVTKAAGGTEPRYRSDGIFADDEDPGRVMDALCQTMNAELRDDSGRLSLHVRHNDLADPDALELGPDDILGSESWKPFPDNSINNIIRGSYVDPSDAALYQMAPAPEVRLASVDGINRIDTMDTTMVQSPSQWQRLAKQRLERAQYQGQYTANFGVRAWGTSLGKIVKLSHPSLGWSNKLFRVIGQTISPDGVCTLVLQEENIAIYAWDTEESPAVTAAVPTQYDPALDPIRQAINEVETTPGPAGLNSAVVYLYKRSLAIPDRPTTESTYTFASGGLTGQDNGWARVIPAGINPIYVITATAVSTEATDTISATEWSGAVVLARNGGNGTDGLNTASIFLYQRNNTGVAPSAPSGTTNYTFASGVLTGIDNGWAQTIPAASDGKYLFVTTATALSNSTTDDIDATEWATVRTMAQDGADGTDGADGSNTALVYLYQRSASAPTNPSTTSTYTFASGVLTGHDNGWSQTIPSGTSPLYVTIASASSSGATDTIASGEWAAPVVLAQNGIDGTDGSNGTNGLNAATVFLYQRNNTGVAPAVPSGPTTYTFASATLTGIDNGWTQTVPAASGGKYLFITTATALSTGSTDSIAAIEWATVRLLAQDGADGAAGSNTALVYLYQRAASTPTNPSTTATFTFATGVLTGHNNGWTQTIPGGTNPLYVTTASANGAGVTDTIASAEWAAPAILAQNGTNGTNGTNGLNNAIVFIYKRSAASPALPSLAGTYTFATGALTGLDNGWTTGVPAANGNPLYVALATASAAGTTDTIAANEWSAPQVMAQDGTTGASGLNVATVQLYKRSATAPALPTTTSTFTFSTGVLTGHDNGWTQTIPGGTTPLYITTATAAATTTTDTIASTEWAAAQILAQNGTDGVNGVNAATVFLYQRNNTGTTPAVPAATTTYTFATGVLSGTLGSWTQTVPAASGGKYLFVTTATALGTGTTDTIATSEWAAVQLLAQDGATGATGPTFSISAPIGGFTFTDGALSPASPQTVTVSAVSNGAAVAVSWSIQKADGTVIRAPAGTASSVAVTDTDLGTNESIVVVATYSGLTAQVPLGRYHKLSQVSLDTVSYTKSNALDSTGALLNVTSDGILSKSEKKNSVVPEWNRIQTAYTTWQAAASARGVTTEKTAHTTAYNALSTYLTTTTTVLNTTYATAVDIADFRAKFKGYYDAEEALAVACNAKAALTADFPSVTGVGVPDSYATGSENVIPNPNFLTGAAPWLIQATSKTSVVSDATGKFLRNSYAAGTSPAMTGADLDHLIPVPTGAKEMTFGMWARSSHQGGGYVPFIYLVVQIYSQTSQYLGQYGVPYTQLTTTGWKFYQVRQTLPDGAYWMAISPEGGYDQASVTQAATIDYRGMYAATVTDWAYGTGGDTKPEDFASSGDNLLFNPALQQGTTQTAGWGTYQGSGFTRVNGALGDHAPSLFRVVSGSGFMSVDEKGGMRFFQVPAGANKMFPEIWARPTVSGGQLQVYGFWHDALGNFAGEMIVNDFSTVANVWKKIGAPVSAPTNAVSASFIINNYSGATCDFAAPRFAGTQTSATDGGTFGSNLKDASGTIVNEAEVRNSRGRLSSSAGVLYYSYVDSTGSSVNVDTEDLNAAGINAGGISETGGRKWAAETGADITAYVTGTSDITISCDSSGTPTADALSQTWLFKLYEYGAQITTGITWTCSTPNGLTSPSITGAGTGNLTITGMTTDTATIVITASRSGKSPRQFTATFTKSLASPPVSGGSGGGTGGSASSQTSGVGNVSSGTAAVISQTGDLNVTVGSTGQVTFTTALTAKAARSSPTGSWVTRHQWERWNGSAWVTQGSTFDATTYTDIDSGVYISTGGSASSTQTVSSLTVGSTCKMRLTAWIVSGSSTNTTKQINYSGQLSLQG